MVTILIIYSNINKKSENKNQILSSKQVILSESVNDVLTTPVPTPLPTLIGESLESAMIGASLESSLFITPTPALNNKSQFEPISSSSTLTSYSNHTYNKYTGLPSPIKTSYNKYPLYIEYKNAALYLNPTKKFLAYPVNIEASNWLANLAGGKGNTVDVSYGKVSSNNTNTVGEEYLVISGSNSSIKYIANSIYINDTYSVYRFWSDKTIQGTSIVKDSSRETLQCIDMFLFSDGTYKLYASNADSNGNNYDGIPKESFYTSDINLKN